MKRYFLYVVLFFISDLAWAQVTVAEFILSATNNADVKTADAQIKYLDASPYKLSPLQKLEFRTQNREMLSTQQEYAVRINPANPWEIRSTNNYFKAYKSSLSLEKERVLKEALVERYDLIILYYYYHAVKVLAQENEKLVEKQLTVLERQTTSSFFDADEYVKLKLEQLDKKAQKEEAVFDWQSQMAAVNKFYPGGACKNFGWESQPIISVSRMEKVADSLVALMIKPLEVSYFEQQVTVARRQYEMEKSNVNLGFFQTSYDRRRVNQERNPFGISLGVTIPITNPNKGDMARRKLSEIESEVELNAVTQEEQGARNVAYQKLKESIAQYHELQRSIDELEKSNLPQQLTQLKNGDPLIVLQFETGINKLRALLVKHQRHVLTDYLGFLAHSDHLQQRPLVNYLSANLAVIGN